LAASDPILAGLPARVQLDRLIGRLFFRTGAGVSVLGALNYLLLPSGLPLQRQYPLVATCLLMALVFLCAGALAPRLRLARTALASGLLSVLALVTLAVGLGEGVHALILGFMGLLICLVSVLSHRRAGFLLAGLSALAVMLMAAAEAFGLLPGSPASAGRPLQLQVATQLLLIGAGLAAGTLMSRVIRRWLEALHEREARFRGLLRIAVDSYWEMDAQCRFTIISDQRRGGIYLTDDPRLGRTPWEVPDYVIDEEALDAHRADLEQRLPFHNLAVGWRDKHGELHHLSISGEPRYDARGAFVGYWGVARAITAEVRAREALVATEARYHELFDRTPSPLILHRGGRVLDANPAAVQLFGYPDLPALLGQDLLAHHDLPADRQRMAARFDGMEAMPVGAALPMQAYGMRTLQGHRLVVRATSVRVDADGGAANLSIYIDDTERHAAEEAVRRSESLLSHLVATSPDLIALTEIASGRFLMINEAFTRQLGYTRDEVIGRTAAELGIWADPDDRHRMLEAARAEDRLSNRPVSFVAKNGARVSALLSAARFSTGGRDYMVITTRDVTDSERERLVHEAILRNASIGIAMTRDGRFLLANARFEQMLGWRPGELIGQPGRAVWPTESGHADIQERIGPALARGEQAEVEMTMARRDGSTFLCRMLAKAVDPIDPSQGGTIWIGEDVTERRQIEQALAKARDEAEAASRAKSAFLANTSHEIRTPLNGLLGLARMARRPEVDDARRRRYLEQISESADTLSGIISDILDLSKIEAGKLSIETVAFRLPELLQSLHHAYGALAEARGLKLTLDADAELPKVVRGDPLRVRQVLSNYLTNALKFTLRGGVRIVARRTEAGPVRFEVHDTGPGIDAATQKRLFRPFTQADDSTTRRYGGTGLGLSICRELAHLMGGRVGVVSRLGQGALFWTELALPACDAAALPESERAGEQLLLQGRRVLMVEDNPVNMMIGVALLEQWGVHVEQASDGEKALRAVDAALRSRRPFDAVLMDVHMPVMSGHEATRVLRGRPETRSLPIIALTAAALVSEREQALAAGMNEFLTKPIDAQRLQASLVRVIGASGRSVAPATDPSA
jgi:PAS domain S-box-containing protein